MSGPAGVPPVLPAAPTPPGSPGGMSRSRIVAIGRALLLAEGDADTGFPDGSGPIWVGRFAPVGSKVDPAIGREVDLDPGVGVVVEDALGVRTASRVPGRNPSTIRAGMSRSRRRVVIVRAYHWQKPCLNVAKHSVVDRLPQSTSETSVL